MPRFAVIGCPVAHSKSPQIHRMFAAQFDTEIDYSAIEVQPAQLSSFVTRFFEADGGGLNVTVPHKQAAYSLCESTSERARQARACNTLLMTETGGLAGDNTDGIGLVNDIKDNHGFDLKGKRVLIIGAGGAVRGILGPLLDQAPAQVTLLNRTVSRAAELVDEFALPELDVKGFENPPTSAIDLIINGTSLGISGEVPPIPTTLAAGSFCYDMMYGSEDTAFVTWARDYGASKSVDGLGMLVEQAAESYRIWHGNRPDTGPVLAALRSGLEPSL